MKKSLVKQIACMALAVVVVASTCFAGSAEAFSFKKLNTKKLLKVVAIDQTAEIEDMVEVMTEGTGNVVVGDYVSAYNVDSAANFFLYPVSVNGVVKYVAHVDAEGNIVVTDNVEVLNAINALGAGEYLVYVDNGTYYATSANKSVELYSEGFVITDEGQNFDGMSYSQMYAEVTENAVASFAEVEKMDVMAVSPIRESASTNAWWDNWGGGGSSSGQTKTKKCGITNFLLQGNYGLCWACTVGTIVNYKTGRNLTGKNVADAMGIGYNTGATIYEIKDALAYYGLSYTVGNKPSWSAVQTNINNDKPFAMCLSASNAGHAITGYGYAYNTSNNSASASTSLVYAWDSNGYQISFKYNASRINTSGYSFQWYGACM